MAYQGRTLIDLAAEVTRQAKSKKDFKAPTTLLEMSVRQPSTPKDVKLEGQPLLVPELQFRVGDQFTGSLTELMHDQLSQEVGIPSKYYNRMRESAPALAAANVNHWLRHTKKTVLVRTLDGKARSLLSNRYRTIDNYDVMEAALPVLMNESKKLGSVEVVSSQVTEKKLYIKVISKRLTYEVKKGDTVQAGIVISNSEVGLGSVRIEPFLLRLICLNGAVIEDSAVRKFHVGRASAELEAAEEVFRDETRKADDKAFVMKLQDVVRAAFDDENFTRLKGMTIDATTRKIKAPIQDVVEEISDRWSLSDKQRGSFMQHLIEGHDTTQWGFANAITAIANNADTYEEATELEKIGGTIMTLDNSQWQQIAA